MVTGRVGNRASVSWLKIQSLWSLAADIAPACSAYAKHLLISGGSSIKRHMLAVGVNLPNARRNAETIVIVFLKEELLF